MYNQTVQKVTDNNENIRFNTSISQMMVFINECYKAEVVPTAYAEGFVKMLSPIAPHLAEELWAKLGHTESITYAEWPTYDETKLVDDEVEIVVQINGKVRAKLLVAKDASREDLEKAALENENVQEHIDGKEIKKLIAVPGKLVNIVAK